MVIFILYIFYVIQFYCLALTRLSMNILLCTSRGRSLNEVIPRNTENIYNMVRYFPGASTNKLAIEANRILRDPRIKKITTHFYIIAGLPDLTVRKVNKRTHYEEVIFEEDPEDAADRIIRLLYSLCDSINSQGPIPILCPVIPSDIEKWNNTRLHQKKTRYLLHGHKYKKMQDNLQLAITLINKQIISYNENNSLKTPFIHRPIIKHITSKTKFRFTFINFPDGVHPNHILTQKWADKLKTAFIANRKVPVPSKMECTQQVDLPSPPRSWRAT